MRYAPLSSIPSHCWLRARFEQLLRSPENFWVKNPFVPDNTTKKAHFVRLLWNINSAPVQVRNIFLLSRLSQTTPLFQHSLWDWTPLRQIGSHTPSIVIHIMVTFIFLTFIPFHFFYWPMWFEKAWSKKLSHQSILQFKKLKKAINAIHCQKPSMQ